MTYVKKVFSLMQNVHYDVIIDMRTTPKSLLFSLFSLSTPYRIGRRKWYSRWLCNYRMETPENMDRVESNLHLMEPLEAEGKLQKDTEFSLYLSDAERIAYRQYMERGGINFKSPVVLAAVTTRIPHKAWPKECMTEILRRLIDTYHPQIIFNYSGEEEEAVARSYYLALNRDPHIFIDIKAKTLRELCALCSASSFFFGNEGGPRHISQAFHIPSFAIFPPDIDKDFWLPGKSERYQGISPNDSVPPEHQVEMSYSGRMSLITVDDVWAGIQPMMDSVIDNFR